MVNYLIVMFFIFGGNGGGERGRRLPASRRTRAGECRAHAYIYTCIMHEYTCPKTRQIYIFSAYAPRDSLLFLNITLAFSSQNANFGRFSGNRQSVFFTKSQVTVHFSLFVPEVSGGRPPPFSRGFRRFPEGRKGRRRGCTSGAPRGVSRRPGCGRFRTLRPHRRVSSGSVPARGSIRGGRAG